MNETNQSLIRFMIKNVEKWHRFVKREINGV